MSKEANSGRSLPTFIEDIKVLSDAALGAATKPENLSSGVGVYIDKMKQEPCYFKNPKEAVIKNELFSRITRVISQKEYTVNDLLINPWDSKRIKISRLTASLIAFSNDHGKKTVSEFFPIEKIFDFLHSVREQAQTMGRQLTVVDQFDIALRQTDNNPVAAALLAHASYRAVARLCDTRLSEKLLFKVESEADPITMMTIARSTADFSMSDVRDPLGDAYHWWAQFSAGMIFTLVKKQYPIQVGILNTAFYFGSNLTLVIREKIQRMSLLSGDHKQVDRQGLRLGKATGDFIVNNSNA
ncbi:MAG: hypothetical protein ABH816_00310 [Candidatus Levyibacteriota bacterium]